MFTQQELNVLATLLNRVQIQGAEAYAVVLLQQKIASLVTTETSDKKAEKKEDK